MKQIDVLIYSHNKMLKRIKEFKEALKKNQLELERYKKKVLEHEES